MYVKFTKKHDAGIPKGKCVKVDDKSGKKFIEEKYAVEISEEDFNSYKAEQSEKAKIKSDKSMKDAEKVNSERHDFNPPIESDESKEEIEGNEEASNNDGADSEKSSSDGGDGQSSTGNEEKK